MIIEYLDDMLKPWSKGQFTPHRQTTAIADNHQITVQNFSDIPQPNKTSTDQSQQTPTGVTH